MRTFRQTGNVPKPMQSDPDGKSELCVQGADQTSDHCHCDCHKYPVLVPSQNNINPRLIASLS